jgi:hypothetical protein
MGTGEGTHKATQCIPEWQIGGSPLDGEVAGLLYRAPDCVPWWLTCLESATLSAC